MVDRDEQIISERVGDTPENHRFAMSSMMAVRCAVYRVYLADVTAIESQLVDDLFLLGVLGVDRPLVLSFGMLGLGMSAVAVAVCRLPDIDPDYT
jgi:hypothetical protein